MTLSRRNPSMNFSFWRESSWQLCLVCKHLKTFYKLSNPIFCSYVLEKNLLCYLLSSLSVEIFYPATFSIHFISHIYICYTFRPMQWHSCQFLNCCKIFMAFTFTLTKFLRNKHKQNVNVWVFSDSSSSNFSFTW